MLLRGCERGFVYADRADFTEQGGCQAAKREAKTLLTPLHIWGIRYRRGRYHLPVPLTCFCSGASGRTPPARRADDIRPSGKSNTVGTTGGFRSAVAILREASGRTPPTRRADELRLRRMNCPPDVNAETGRRGRRPLHAHELSCGHECGNGAPRTSPPTRT